MRLPLKPCLDKVKLITHPEKEELNSDAAAPTAVVLSLVLGTTMMMMMLAFTASTASEAVSRGRLLLGGHCFQ